MKPCRTYVLHDYLETERTRVFSWAGDHCAAFAAGWVEIATGKRPEFPAVGSVAEAIRVVRELGGLPAAVDARNVGTPIDPKLAQVGDLVYRPPEQEGGTGALGVCCGRLATFRALDQLTTVPMSEVTRAWKL